MKKNGFKGVFCAKERNIIRCHSQGLLLGISDILSSLINKKKALCINDTYAGEPRQNSSGMTTLLTTTRGFAGQALPDSAPAKGHLAAFTLIELLVVILIIGILAAAVPQYQVAVAKARYMQLITLANALRKGQDIYRLANGTFAEDIRKLA